MGVIVELTLPAEEFFLGRILAAGPHSRVVLETLVPLGNQPVPFLRVFDGEESFETAVRENAAVGDFRRVSSHDGEVLYALDWDITEDEFFGAIAQNDGTVLTASEIGARWRFDIRFEEHEAVAAFQTSCRQAEIPVTFDRLFHPTRPEAGPWYGLSEPQRSTLIRAVEAGYFSIPREITTRELAAEFDISDQAITERLRRGITNLVESTIRVSEGSEVT
jgi:hypothetical protein